MTAVLDLGAAVQRPLAARLEAAVSVQSVSKRFPVRRGWREFARAPWAAEYAQVIERVTIDVHVGEFFGILGPNGAGKTTLFRILGSLLLPDSGRAMILGHDVERERASVRTLVGSVVSDERTLYWRLTAEENLRLFGALHGLRGAALTRRVEEVLATVDLRATGSRMVATFSSGMRQRLLIARALLSRPQVLLLDEPTRSLDPLAARDLRRFLRNRLVRDEGCTILLATHSGEEAMAHCDRIAVLNHGHVLAVGTPATLARALGDQRFVLWTRTPAHPALHGLEARGLVLDVAPGEADDEGWSSVGLTIPGDTAAAARVLHLLQSAGVQVGRFERTQLSLADLIERVVTRFGTARA